MSTTVESLFRILSRDLPAGYSVRIDIQNGSVTASSWDASGVQFLPDWSKPIGQQLLECLKAAIHKEWEKKNNG